MSESNSYSASSRVPSEAELESLLDEESDEAFGQTELEVASPEKRAVLKEWTANDFANIYSRFRPQLERHARRFLRNPSQVDEVVQDAFLYLMVSLPDLDSELGVLRFLKWKTRLLALDVIRASKRYQESDLDEHAEALASGEPEISIDLERAEDAAVVRLALAKLAPRQREVLIASIYEEKSTPAIAAQVGLSENATRQLIFRARTALKKALVGDAETAGLTLSEILSVAARKAAQEAKRVGPGVLGILTIASLGLVGILNISTTPNAQVAGQLSTSASPIEPAVPRAPTSELPQEFTLKAENQEFLGGDRLANSDPNNETFDSDSDAPAPEIAAATSSEAPVVSLAADLTENLESVEISVAELLSNSTSVFPTSALTAQLVPSPRFGSEQVVQLQVSPSLQVLATVSPTSLEITNLSLVLSTEMGFVAAYPEFVGTSASLDEATGLVTASATATNLTFIDPENRVKRVNNSENAVVTVTLEQEAKSGRILNSSVSFFVKPEQE